MGVTVTDGVVVTRGTGDTTTGATADPTPITGTTASRSKVKFTGEDNLRETQEI